MVSVGFTVTAIAVIEGNSTVELCVNSSSVAGGNEVDVVAQVSVEGGEAIGKNFMYHRSTFFHCHLIFVGRKINNL